MQQRTARARLNEQRKLKTIDQIGLTEVNTPGCDRQTLSREKESVTEFHADLRQPEEETSKPQQIKPQARSPGSHSNESKEQAEHPAEF